MARQDLKPVRTKEEAKQRGRNGGIASGKSRQRKKSLKEAAIAMLEAVRKNPETGIEENGYEAVAAALCLRASMGDVTAINSLRDLIGEKPTDRVEMDSHIEVVFNIPRPGKTRKKRNEDSSPVQTE